jgi:hypothetical protein
MDAERIKSVTADLESISEDARSSFGHLTGAQLNWKPDAKSWSVAQCLDHLIVINTLYFPLFEKLKAGPVETTFWEKHSPLSGFFGRYLIKAMGPENPKKVKTSKLAYPSASEIDVTIVEKFREHNRELGSRIANIPPTVDAAKIITSPLSGVVTYSLDDCLTILVVHEHRHLLQAKRVISGSDFAS